MENIIFKSILLIFIISCGIIRMPFMKKCKKNNIINSVLPGFEKFKVFFAWLGMCFIPFIYIFTDFLNKFDFAMPLWSRIIFSICLILNAYFFYIIHKELNTNWSPILELNDSHKLVKTGVYKYVRHPMYTQSWLWVILQGLVASNIFVLAFGVVTWGFMYFTRVFNEEKMMRQCFGNEYDEYMQQTGRLLPKLLK